MAQAPKNILQEKPRQFTPQEKRVLDTRAIDILAGALSAFQGANLDTMLRQQSANPQERTYLANVLKTKVAAVKRAAGIK